MPLRTVKLSLAKAEDLLNRSQLAALDELIAVCALGLGHLAREASAYRDALPFCASLARHFEKELAELVAILETCDQEDITEAARTRYGVIQERAFCLVEDIALFMREKKLRAGSVEQSQPEERVMAFFETSGHWPPSERLLVTDLYYTQIPLAVASSLNVAKVDSPLRPRA